MEPPNLGTLNGGGVETAWSLLPSGAKNGSDARCLPPPATLRGTTFGVEKIGHRDRQAVAEIVLRQLGEPIGACPRLRTPPRTASPLPSS